MRCKDETTERERDKRDTNKELDSWGSARGRRGVRDGGFRLASLPRAGCAALSGAGWLSIYVDVMNNLTI